MDELKQQRSELIELLGVYLEQERQVAPLAARILATLIINGNLGTTFEQLVHELEASKSTISNHLTMLENNQSIIYFTKCGDRKRYYTMAPGYFARKITSLTNQWKQEYHLHQKTLEYKLNYNRVHNEQPVSTHIHENAIDFFQNTLSFFEKLLEEFKQKEEKHNIHKL